MGPNTIYHLRLRTNEALALQELLHYWLCGASVTPAAENNTNLGHCYAKLLQLSNLNPPGTDTIPI
jgi:hypothetical protein